MYNKKGKGQNKKSLSILRSAEFRLATIPNPVKKPERALFLQERRILTNRTYPIFTQPSGELTHAFQTVSTVFIKKALA